MAGYEQLLIPPGLFITEDFQLLGLRGRWVAPATTTWIRQGDFNDVVLDKREWDKYPEGAIGCNGSMEVRDMVECSRTWYMKEFLEANCSYRELFKYLLFSY